MARDQIQRRELLYSDYLAEARRLTSEAVFRKLEFPKDLDTIDRMLAQMSLLSPAGVTEAARELRRYLVRARSNEKDLSADEPAINQLSKTFIDAARADLGTFRDATLP